MQPVATATAGTPFGLDLLAAIALQESGEIWRQLRGKVDLDELLELCVGASLDDDKGRKAFPKNQAALLAVPRGNDMFEIAHDALVRMAVHVKGYQPAAKKAHKFCRGFGIFQYDLQFFKVDPDYFLERRWRHFDLALRRCIKELHAAQKRIGLADRSTLTDLEQVHVAKNCAASWRPSSTIWRSTRWRMSAISLATAQPSATSMRTISAIWQVLYLPRVWWTPDAVERLTRGERVEPRLASTIDEQRANDLFRWLRAFGPRFGWRQAGSLTELQTEANVGAVGVIVARRKIDGRSGHITIVVPETDDERAKRDATGAVTAPLQSQAGTRNFRYGTSTPNWWNGEQFADSAFWIHA